MGLERERTYVEAQEAVGSDVDGHPAVGTDELPEAGSMRHTIHDLIHESPSTLDSSANARERKFGKTHRRRRQRSNDALRRELESARHHVAAKCRTTGIR